MRRGRHRLRAAPALSVDLSSYGLVVWVEEGGSTFDVWQGGKQLV